MELKVGVVSDRGLNPRRPVNEDRYLAVAERGLFAVFDGVGGQRAGEIASQTAAETIEESLTHDNAGSSLELIRRAIQFANRDVFEMAESDPSLKTMATTVALLHVEGNRATIAHVGDSRVYRLEEGRFYRETIDHTDLNDDIRAGRVAENKAAEAAQRNVINRALGVEADVDIEIKSIDVRDGARFLLCSDGIYRHLTDEEIARVLAENKDTQRAADELKRIVHERGADDNLTAVVVQAGRARQSRVLSIEDGLPTRGEAVGAGAAEAPAMTGSARGGRIRVEFDRAQANERTLIDEKARSADERARQIRVPLDRGQPRASASRKVMWALVVMVLVAGAFYAGLRASDYFNGGSSEPSAAYVQPDPMRTGREAFERGDYQAALAEFDSLSKREPMNVKARYWLARAQLEVGQYQLAAQNLDEVTRAQPAMAEAYLYAAAAYEASGNRLRAAQMLDAYGDRRREQPAASGNANSSLR